MYSNESASWGALFDVDIHRLVLISSVDELHDEALEPYARIHYHPHFAVLAHEDAALGVLGCIACVDADTGEARDSSMFFGPRLVLFTPSTDGR